MNQANQQVVNQNANITLISIRQAEITYFSTFFSNFGTQCFLLAGILAGSISQTPGFECVTDCVFFWQIFYNVSAATCLALTCLVLLAAVFISVFGQGLAIRGPTGSMIQTIQGMVAEQQNVVRLFACVVITFMMQLVGMYFIVMEWEWATVCAVITGCGTYYTYYCAVRIFNRFKWDDSKSGWNFDREDNQEKELSELSPEVLQELMNTTKGTEEESIISPKKVQDLYRVSVEKGLIQENDSNEKKKNVLLKMMKRISNIGGGISNTSNTTNTANNNTPRDNNGIPKFDDVHFEDISSSSDHPYQEMADNTQNKTNNTDNSQKNNDRKAGYLTVKVANPNPSILSMKKEKWIRYYFILKGNYMYYYEDRRAFEKNASKPINTRPIDLEGYNLVPGADEPPFAFSLVPSSADDIRKTWKFRCDTHNEFHSWCHVIEKAIPIQTNSTLSALNL